MAKATASSKLLLETLALVKNRPRPQTYGVISEATGIPVEFLQNLMAGRIKDPGVIRIERLYNHLAKEKLSLSVAA